MHGVDIDWKDAPGRSPPHRALGRSYDEIAEVWRLDTLRILLQYGSDLGFWDTRSFGPASLAMYTQDTGSL